MGMLADMLQNSLLQTSAIENERPVILREAEEVAKQDEEVTTTLTFQFLVFYLVFLSKAAIGNVRCDSTTS